MLLVLQYHFLFLLALFRLSLQSLFTLTSHSYIGLNSSVITRCRCCFVYLAVASSVSIVSLGQRLDSSAISLSSPLGGGLSRVSISPCNGSCLLSFNCISGSASGQYCNLSVLSSWRWFAKSFNFPLQPAWWCFYTSLTRVCFPGVWLALLPLLEGPSKHEGLACLSEARSLIGFLLFNLNLLCY